MHVHVYFEFLFKIDWAATMRSMWKFSEDDAYNALQNFLSDGKCIMKAYETQ